VSPLLAVPNVSEGRDAETIQAIAGAFRSGCRVLDIHTDPDHNRSVFTLAGQPVALAEAVLVGAREALNRVDLSVHAGIHPRVGVTDVAPIVYVTEADRGAACAEALVLADLLGDELELPVFLYGELGGGRTRAELRTGGVEGLAARLESGELNPDFGPGSLDPIKGAVLVAARPPLIAFNLELGPPATEADAKRIAAEVRETAPDGLPGVRAIGLWLDHRGRAQISTNVEDHQRTPLAALIEAVAAHAPIAEAELVGLAPEQAFDGFPDEIAVRNRRTIEDALTGAR
jgi:glutamate formiminotransferase/glutamate formiminotransferase/formiminotetrahydrofolate cyclodeaminase